MTTYTYTATVRSSRSGERLVIVPRRYTAGLTVEPERDARDPKKWECKEDARWEASVYAASNGFDPAEVEVWHQ